MDKNYGMEWYVIIGKLLWHEQNNTPQAMLLQKIVNFKVVTLAPLHIGLYHIILLLNIFL